MSSSGLIDKEPDSYAHAYCFPDNAYASVQITGVRYDIDREVIQGHLCQTCLDTINEMSAQTGTSDSVSVTLKQK